MATNTILSKIKLKTKTEAQWTSSNPVLLAGEIGISSDKNGIFKVGDGKTAWKSLKYSYTNVSISDSINIRSSSSIAISCTGASISIEDRNIDIGGESTNSINIEAEFGVRLFSTTTIDIESHGGSVCITNADITFKKNTIYSTAFGIKYDELTVYAPLKASAFK